jgi:hypothetical protein
MKAPGIEEPLKVEVAFSAEVPMGELYGTVATPGVQLIVELSCTMVRSAECPSSIR